MSWQSNNTIGKPNVHVYSPLKKQKEENIVLYLCKSWQVKTWVNPLKLKCNVGVNMVSHVITENSYTDRQSCSCCHLVVLSFILHGGVWIDLAAMSPWKWKNLWSQNLCLFTSAGLKRNQKIENIDKTELLLLVHEKLKTTYGSKTSQSSSYEVSAGAGGNVCV